MTSESVQREETQESSASMHNRSDPKSSFICWFLLGHISRYVMERLKKKECKMWKTTGYSTDDENKSDAEDEEMSDTNDQSDEWRKLKIDMWSEGEGVGEQNHEEEHW